MNKKNILISLSMFVLAIFVVSAEAKHVNHTKKNKKKYAINNKIIPHSEYHPFYEHNIPHVVGKETNIVFASNPIESQSEIQTEEQTEEVESNNITDNNILEGINSNNNSSYENDNISDGNDNNKDSAYFKLSEEERNIVECIVMGEAGGESYKGQVLVAQCILNACIKDNSSPSVIRNTYKYVGWKNNPSESVKKAVSEVFDKGYKVTDEFILYFYAPKYCTSSWHESQRYILTEGVHRFFAANN